MKNKKYRLVTKADFDGMVCGVLLKELGIIDSIVFSYPKDIETGRFNITDNDITAGLPYKECVHLAFDHYPGALISGGDRKNLIVDTNMPSTSRVIYNYYGEDKFPAIQRDMLDAVDKGFSGKISRDEILYPTGWILFNYLIDHRTGLDRFKKFTISHSELIIKLVDLCRGHNIWEILNMPEVEERLNLYFSYIEQYKAQLLRCASVYYNLVVIDLRREKVIYPGNRFMIYAMFPECNVSLEVVQDSSNNKTIFVAGKSVLDRSFSKDIGRIMRRYGGGGHPNAGTCQVNGNNADKVLRDITAELSYSMLKNLFMGYFNYHRSTVID